MMKYSMFTAVAAAMLLGGTNAHAGAVQGKVTLDGDRPERREIEMVEANIAGKRPSACAKLHEEPLLEEEELVAEDGSIQNVFVWIDDAPKGDYPVPSDPAVLDQVGCMFTPRVLGVRTGQELEIRNSDNVTHNVRAMPRRNRPFNLGEEPGAVRTKTLRRAEESIKMKCDIHRWMTGYVFSMDHPYFAVTDADGKFTLPGELPAGTYELKTWHEKYGEIEHELTVEESGVIDVNLAYDLPE